MSRRLISPEVALDVYPCKNPANQNSIKKLMKSVKKVNRNKSIRIKWKEDIPMFIPKDELTLFNKQDYYNSIEKLEQKYGNEL